MSNRYIERFRLSARLYAETSPVVLAAGVLLEDTKIPRRVIQLKFKSLSAKPISSLKVALRCFGPDGEALPGLGFTYEALYAVRGQAFGQYTAIPLPEGEACSFSAAVRSVSFADGSIWRAPTDAKWRALPAFTPLEEALSDQELFRRAAETLPRAKFAYAAPADLWYCACGGVNRGEEGACHRCEAERALVSRYADPMRSLPKEEVPLSEAREEEAESPALPPESGLEWAETAVSSPVPPDAPTPLQGEGEIVPPLPTAEARPAGGKAGWAWGKRIALFFAGAAVIAMAIFFLPQLFTGGEDPAAPPLTLGPSMAATTAPASVGPKKDETIAVTTPSDGETFFLTLYEDGEGSCTLTREELRGLFPDMQYFHFDGVAHLGNDLDAYLANTFHMSRLVASNGREGSDEQYGRFSARRDPGSPRCLMVFSGPTTLIGYAIGVPEKVSEGVWQLSVTRCNEEFDALYRERANSFSEAKEPPFISPEEIDGSGAKWFLNAFNMRSDTEEFKKLQLYYLWNQYSSPYLERHLRSMSTFDDKRPEGSGDSVRFRYYFLFDEKQRLLGYTKLSSLTGAGQAEEPPRITTDSDGETVLLELAPDADGHYALSLEALKVYFPEVKYYDFAGYKDLGSDLNAYIADSYHMARLIGSGSVEGGQYTLWRATEGERILLLFSDQKTLSGHAIGRSELGADGILRITVTRCNYEFSALYNERAGAFFSEEVPPFIPLSEVKSCGATRFLYAYNFRTDEDWARNAQLYHVFNQYSSPYLHVHLRDIERFDSYAPTGPNGTDDGLRYRYYLLFDKNNQVLGYTTRSTADV